MLYTFSATRFNAETSPETFNPNIRHLPSWVPFSVSVPRISALASVSRVQRSQEIGDRARDQARDTAAKK